MKKVILTIAAIAAFCSCAKELSNSQEPKMYTVDLTLTVDKDATKTAYDGDSHIKWLAGDDLAVMIDTKSGSQSHKGAYRYSQFKIGSDLENPVFSGSMSWMDDQAQEKMWVYGFYPFSACASATECDIHAKNVLLPGAQTFTADSWDGKADVMAIEPVQLEGTPGGTSGYYSWASDLTVKFAHVFGFGCISFAGLPEELGAEDLKKVFITATNAEAATNPMAGTFAVNFEENVINADNAVSYKSNANNTLSLTAAEAVAIKDSKVWFVANPGTYDVTIQAMTADHKITYQRTGLKIERAKIAKPVLNLKDADVVSSTAVDVTGKSWKHNATDAYAASGSEKFFTNGKDVVNWGTLEGCDPMEMNLSYVGAGTGYYGTPQSKNNIYTQDFNYSAGRNLAGVTVTVASSAKFIGMKAVKVNAGDYKQPYSGDPYTCKLKAFVTDGDGKHQIGETETITGSTASREGTDFFFNTGNYTEGTLTIEMSEFSTNYAAPYIGEVEINPVPGITLGSLSASFLSEAVSADFDCKVSLADEAPSVSANVDWIHPSYSEGKVSYTVDANNSDLNREGTITIKASNENGTSTAEFAVSQLGNVYVQYTMNITYNDIKDALIAAGAEDLAAGKITNSTYYSFDINALASSPNGDVKRVGISCKNILYNYSVENETISVYGGSTYGRIVSTSPVFAITGIEAMVQEGQSAPSVKLGTSSDNISTTLTMTPLATNPYAFEGSASFADKMSYFQAGADSWSYKYHYMYYVKVTFIDEVEGL
ncbi:MAG: BACON domain-containing protein [Bacteroidales bacterium]|nr:BACON domain-containing protein [Bacteroidales bacterium]